MYSDERILILEWTADGEDGFNHYVLGNPPLLFDYYRSVMERYGL